MPSVAAYRAALETTESQFSYAFETTWATLPAVQFQATRLISEDLRHQKARTRPGEIRGDRQTAKGVTTGESASGPLVLPGYYGGLDDWFACLLGGDWQVNSAVTGAAGDISLTYTGGVTTLASTATNKFQYLLVGTIVKLNGFTNAVNNGFYRITAKPSNMSMTVKPLGFVPVTETPAGTAAKVAYSNLKNSTQVKTVFGQQRMDAEGTIWFRYPALYPTRGVLSLSLNNFLQLSLDTIAQQELSATTNASTGAVLPASGTDIMDPVSSFQGVFWNDTELTQICDSLSYTFTRDGAAMDYGMGSGLGQGLAAGSFMAAASVSLGFKELSLYQLFRAETVGSLTSLFSDVAGNTYAITANNALLMNPDTPTSGNNRSLRSAYDVEINPDVPSGCTISIDRFNAGS